MSQYTVGILDSGVGGFSVVRPILARIPDLSFVYVADTGHVPYSNKTIEELELYVGRILHYFLNLNVKFVLFACNTSSALILPRIGSTFPVPVVGVVEPGVKGALSATKGKGIGLVANEVTAKSGVFRRLIAEKSPKIPVIEVSCPDLVPLVESGDTDSPHAAELVEAYCKPLAGKIDTLIFGCTHFPYLEKWFRKFLPGVNMIDPAPILADDLVPVITRDSSRPLGQRKLVATGPSPNVAEWAKRVLGWDARVQFDSMESLPSWIRKTPR